MVKGGPVEQEQQLMADIFSFRNDPLKFIMYAFPWGDPGTPLSNATGPRRWQLEVIEDIRQHIISNGNRLSAGDGPKIFQLCRASGRGIGKSALLAMLGLWFMSTIPGSSVIITANTEDQLKSRTFAEIGKWLTLAINGHWFEKQKLKVEPAGWFAIELKKQLKVGTDYYYIDGQLWNDDNPGAFAGVHNLNGIMVIFDEAATIPSSIWDVTTGFFSDKVEHRYWLNFSNPRLNTGAFYDCFHGPRRPYWNTACIDSREIEGADLALFQQIIDTHGEDSDVARVEVKGQFPTQGETQFISRGVVEEAQVRESSEDGGAPLLLGVDIARFGDDSTVLFARQGRDARSIEPLTFRKLDTQQVSHRVAEWCDKYNPDGVFVDGGGVGGGVVDMLRAMRYKVFEINGGSSPDNKLDYQNKRVEMWARMKEWLDTGCVWKQSHKGVGSSVCPLETDLLSPTYDYDLHHKLKLEQKAVMKKRGAASPDYADALALTFAMNVGRKDAGARKRRRKMIATDMNCSPFT